MKWHSKSCGEAVKILDSHMENGLTDAQADERLHEYGPNRLTEKKKTSLFVRFLMQLNDFMILILLLAAGVSAGVSYLNGENDFADPLIILAIVILNAVLGLAQESRAEKSIEALRKMTVPKAKVIRNGKLVQLESEQLVPGDLMVLETGDLVPADGRLITAVNLQAEESALTGESLPSEKNEKQVLNEGIAMGDMRNMLFAGSCVTYGRGTALCTATGMDTQMGRIAGMIMEHEAPDTPLQKKLTETGKILGMGALCICFVIFVLGILRHMPAFEMFMTSVSLAVAAIPEGLPAIVTIMLAMGVQRMVRHNAIIRKLPAVETLGSASVICSDKTGTLTQNKMRVVELWNGTSGFRADKTSAKHMLAMAALCCNTRTRREEDGAEVVGEPTEVALVQAAQYYRVDKDEWDARLPRVDEMPFDSQRKLMSTVHRKPEGGRYLVITKGAPDVLLGKCTGIWADGRAATFTEVRKKEVVGANVTMADKALRVLAVAYKETSKIPTKSEMEKDLIFVGLAGMIDPPREEVADAVALCKMAGIRPVMITGDHVVTARAIAGKIGIASAAGQAVTGEELSRMSQEELNNRIEDYRVFARVSPEHKVRIVKAFQSRGAVVAMTGDGVNDAPALKAADIGCAMGLSGTDVAKGAADMVLTDDNFATIVEAIRQGRGIYENIKKSVHFLLSSNIGEIIVILTAILMGWPTPLLPIHLLWVNLVTDSLPAIALGVDPAEKDIMSRRPIDNHKSLFSGGLWQRIGAEGLMIGLLALLAFGIGTVYFDEPGGHLIGRTMCFATLSIAELFHAFNMRSEHSLFSIDLFDNLYLVGALLLGVVMQTAVISIDALNTIFKVAGLNSAQWLIVMGLSVLPIVIVELQKLWHPAGTWRMEASRGLDG